MRHVPFRVSRESTLLVSFFVSILPAVFFIFYEPKLALGWVSGAVIFFGALYRRKIGEELVLAILFALIATSYTTYTYTSGNALIGHINLFPLVAWTAGLTLLREVYERLDLTYKLISACLLYWIFLFIFEYVGYYILGIRIATDQPALFGLGIIHGPPFIHIFYLSAGPLYLIAANYLRLR